MKSLAWLLLLSGLVFGIGWKSSSLARSGMLDGGPAGLPHFEGSGDPADRGHHRGPLLGSAEEFADQLDLSVDQRAALAALVSATTESIRNHEKAIWELRNEGRRKIHDLLTEAQSTRLSQLLEERFQTFVREQIGSQVEWFRQQVPAPEVAQLTAIEAIITAYEDGKRVLFGGPGGAPEGGSLPEDGRERGEVDTRLADMRRERDERLRPLVGDEILERFQTLRRRGGGRRPSFRTHESPESPVKEEH